MGVVATGVVVGAMLFAAIVATALSDEVGHLWVGGRGVVWGVGSFFFKLFDEQVEKGNGEKDKNGMQKIN